MPGNPSAESRPLQAPRQARDGSRIYTVSELTRAIRGTLETAFGSVWVAGEVSNLRIPASGHCYFTLKDEGAQLSAVMWRTTLETLKFKLKEGLAVLAHGEMTVYEPRGQYQIVVRRIEPMGMGALQTAFLELRDRLAKEGLFDPARKRPLPAFPRTIALVTSPTGAAVQDMIRTIQARCPLVRLIVVPVRVQGEGAAKEIADGIGIVNRMKDVDVMIVGRGGGSLEDLWPFNEEVVARAIAASRAPVISAVGHETDFTISDFVADVRALTPTDAGHRVVPDIKVIMDEVEESAGRMAQALKERIESARQRLDDLSQRSEMRRFLERLRAREQPLDDLCQRLYADIRHFIKLKDEQARGLSGRLESLSPLAVLQRGYSLTWRDADGALLRDASAVRAGDLVRTRLAKGEFHSRVESP